MFYCRTAHFITLSDLYLMIIIIHLFCKLPSLSTSRLFLMPLLSGLVHHTHFEFVRLMLPVAMKCHTYTHYASYNKITNNTK